MPQVFGGFDDLEVERVGYSSPKPAVSQNGGFMPLDQALSNLPNIAPNILSPLETNHTVSAPSADDIKKAEERKQKILQEISFHRIEAKSDIPAEIPDRKTTIGGIDHLEFKTNVVLEEVKAVEPSNPIEAEIITQEKPQPKVEQPKVLKAIKDELIDQAKTFTKKAFKESKEVYKAVLELGKMIFFKGKSREQLAKEQETKKKNMEKAANKKSFFDSLRTAIFEFQNKKMKQRMENRKRLNIIGVAPDQANQFLGEHRNISFEDLNSDYYDEQTAIGMFYRREIEKKAKAQAEAKAKGTDLTAQFSQARFAGERGAGHNAQSATG